jgi:hypothetical protein
MKMFSPLRMITTMVFLVIFAPFLYVKLVQDYPDSFWTRHFIWVYFVLLIVIFLSALDFKRH